jgi:HNH endonuclease/Domain of unknown function (DUF222)
MRGWTPDQIEQALIAEEREIARSRGRQMALLALADQLQMATADGCKSLKEWASGRLDLSPETAYRLTTTARRLTDSPELARQLMAGDATFDRIEAEARIPESSRGDHLEFLDIAGLRRVAALHRHLDRADDFDSHRSQHLNLQPNLDESAWSIWGELDGYSGAVVDKVLTEAADEIPNLPDGTRTGLGYRRAVALTSICESSRSETATTPLITVFVDGHGVEVASGTAVGPAILDKLACAGSVEVINAADGRPLALGRRSRVIPNKLRRFVLHRDGGCTADGCTSRYRLQAHHVTPWSEGGPTDPDNLTTLCWFHHHVVVHGQGFRIDPRLGSGRIRFIRPGLDPP